MRSPPRRRACARDRHGLGEALEAPLVPGGRGTTHYSPTEGSLEFRRPKDTIELFTHGNAGRGRARECFSNAVLLHLALPTSLFLDFTQRLQLVCVHAWAHRAQSGATQSYTGLTRKTSLRTRDSKLATQRCQAPPPTSPAQRRMCRDTIALRRGKGRFALANLVLLVLARRRSSRASAEKRWP